MHGTKLILFASSAIIFATTTSAVSVAKKSPLTSDSSLAIIQEWPDNKSFRNWMIADERGHGSNNQPEADSYHVINLLATLHGPQANISVEITIPDDGDASELTVAFRTARVQAVQTFEVIEQRVSGSTFSAMLSAPHGLCELRIEMYGKKALLVPSPHIKIFPTITKRHRHRALDRHGDDHLTKSLLPTASPPPMDAANSGTVRDRVSLVALILTMLTTFRFDVSILIKPFDYFTSE